MWGLHDIRMRVIAAVLAGVLALVTPLSYAGEAYAAEPAGESTSAPPPESSSTTSTESTSTDPNILPAGAAEDVSLRTETSNTYDLPDGTKLAVISAEPVNYKDESGAWQVIDTTLVRSDEAGRYESASTGAKVSIGRSGLTEEPVRVTSGGHTVGIDMAGAVEGIPGVSGSSATFGFVAPATELVYEVTNTGVKETLVLGSALAPSTFTFTIDAGGLAVRRDFDGMWRLYSEASKEPVFTIGTLSVFDSSVSETGEHAYCADARMEVVPTESGALITYTIPREWLNDPARVFPVMVDPTLTTGANADTFVSSGAPTSSFGSLEMLSCGYYDASSGHRRSYVKFDVSSIPTYARVDSATFSLYQYWTYYTSTATTTYLAQPTASWTESVTWNSKPSQSAVIASQSVTGRGVWVNWNQTAVKNAVASWVASPSGNRGFVCYQNENGSENTTHYRLFYSSNYSDSSLRPKLVVNYTTIPDPVTNVSASTNSSFGWFREVDRNGDLLADNPADSGTEGRGEVSLSWATAARAAGYTIYAWDGDAYHAVGKVLGGSTTTWSSEGAGMYPLDSPIMSWQPGSRNSFTGASSPSAAQNVAGFTAEGCSKAGVLVTDGTFLYVRGWSDGGETDAWQKVGTGLSGTTQAENYGQVGKVFEGEPVLSAFYLDGVIYNGYATSATTLTGVPKSAQPDEMTTVTMSFDEPLLRRETANAVTTPSGGILVASDGERIYNVCYDVPGGGDYDQWTIRVFDRTGQWLYDKTIAGSYYTDGVLADGKNLYLIEATHTNSARVTKVRTDDFTVQNQWTIDQSYRYLINGCYNPATNSFYLGDYLSAVVYRYTGIGLDLRDNPERLYEKGSNATYYDSENYWFRVVPFNPDGESAAILDCTAYQPTLENRTVRVNDEDRDTSSSIGEVAGHSMTAVLDEAALEVSVTDLEIASYGPDAAVTRTYLSSRTTDGLLANAPGWRFGFEASASAVTGGVAVTDGEGLTRTYVLEGGAYNAPNGCYDTLVATDETWVVIHKDRSRDIYDKQTGRLLATCEKTVETDDPDSVSTGEAAVLYDWGTAGALTITAANGQTIEVAFESGSGDIASATYASDDGTRTVDYATGTDPPAVTYFVGDEDCEYEVDYAYTSLRLTEISVPDYPGQGQTAEWLFTHDATGRITSARSPVQSDAEKTVYGYDDNSPLTSDDTSLTVSTSGSWVACSDLPSCYNSTYRYSYTAGASATYSFVGTAVTFIGMKGPIYGKAKIYIDNIEMTTVDCFASSYSYQQEIYSTSQLAVGKLHTIKVEVTGTKNPSSNGYTVIVDAFRYTPHQAVTVTTRGDVAGGTTPSVTEDAAVYVDYVINPTGTVGSMTDPHLAGAPNPGTWEYTYASSNEAVYELAPSEKSVSRQVDSHGNTTSTFDEEGHRTIYVYDAVDQLIRETDPRGCTTCYTYSNSLASDPYDCYGGTGLLVALERQLNPTERSSTTYAYDDTTGRKTLERTLLAGNRWIATSYGYTGSSTDAPSSTTMKAQTLSGSTYTDASISLSATETVSGITTSKTYDDFGNVTGEMDAADVTTLSNTAYSIAGRLESSVDVDGVTTTNWYDKLGNLTESKQTVAENGGGSTLNAWTRKAYDGAGRLVSEETVNESGTANSTTTRYYDARGLEVRNVDSVSGTTWTWFDERGHDVWSWAPGSITSAPSSSVVDKATRTTYDCYGQETSSIAPGEDADAATETEYRPDGLVSQITNPDESFSVYTYDDGGLPIAVSAPCADSPSELAVSRTIYDIGGRATRTISPEGLTNATYYDLADRPLRTTTVTFDANGVETGETTATVTTYNELGWVLTSTDANGVTTSNGYDVLGDVESAVSRDASGATVKSVGSTYDAKKRLKSQVVCEGSVVSEVTYDYDAFGRVKAESHEKNNAVYKSVSTTYDEFSRPLSTTDDKTDISHEYAYAGAGTAKSLDTASFGGVILATNYDTFDREYKQEGTLFDGAVSLSRLATWDTVTNRVTSATTAIRSTSATETCSESYEYDAADKLVGITGGLWGSGEVAATYNTASATKATDTVSFPWGGSLFSRGRTFTYTDAGRLASVSSDRLVSYLWDTTGSGDLMRVTDGGVQTDFTYVDGHLATTECESEVTTYTFDTGGRRILETTSLGSVETSWTGADCLLSWIHKDAQQVVLGSATYSCDGNGQRMAASVTATSALSPEAAVETQYTYAWEGTDLAVFEAESETASATVSYLFSESDRPYAAAVSFTGLGGSQETTSVAVRLLVNDHGDVVALADETGETFARYDYGVFGEDEGVTTRATGLLSEAEAAFIADFQPLRYASYCYDTWSGHYYLQARYYDPLTKQFLSKDPAKSDGEESAYQYCGGDPVNAVDPDGQFAWAAAGAVVGGLVGGGVAYWKAKKAGKTGWELAALVGLGVVDGAVTGAGLGGLAKFAVKSVGKLALKRLAKREMASISEDIARSSGRGMSAGQRIRLNNAVGRVGEAQRGIQAQGKRAIRVADRIRYPDRITRTTVEEIKNAKRLSYTRQLRDYQQWASMNNRKLVVHVRRNTELSGPLKEAWSRGELQIRRSLR